MTIGIDVSMLVYAGSGVATYTYNFVKALLVNHPEHTYKLFYTSMRKPKNFYYLDDLRNHGAKVYEYRMPNKLITLLWNTWHVLPVEWLIGDIDVFHSSDYLRPPLSKKVHAVTTVHDLTWKLFPEYHTENVIQAHTNKLRKTIKFGDTIVADSLNSKNDLLKEYPEVDEERVEVLYLGVSEHFKKVKDAKKIKRVRKRYGILPDEKYLLYVGAIEPRKNLKTCVKVFHKLVQKKKFADYSFIIGGRAGWKNENLFALIKERGLESKVRFVGFVEDEDLPALYTDAEVFLYLSKYEGFGLPPIEAARCGTPTLLYKNSSLKEIFPGKYPYAVEGKELTALENMLTKKPKLDQTFFRKFSWKRYADQIVKVYKASD